MRDFLLTILTTGISVIGTIIIESEGQYSRLPNQPVYTNVYENQKPAYVQASPTPIVEEYSSPYEYYYNSPNENYYSSPYEYHYKKYSRRHYGYCK